jgi:excisionase family DNA binding protein
MSTQTRPEWLTVVQAAKVLNLSPRAVLHRITSGKISASKLGEGRTSAYIITAAEVERVKSVA